MKILAVKTEGDVSYLGVIEGNKVLAEKSWQSGRELARDILREIGELLATCHLTLSDIGGIVVFRGPGSFTSLRIGCTTLNTLAYAQKIPIVGSEDDKWLQNGVSRLTNGEDDRIVTPFYGVDPYISLQKK